MFGALGGFGTFIAHSASPPLSVYLLRRGLPKTIYVGTMVALLILSEHLQDRPLRLGLACSGRRRCSRALPVAAADGSDRRLCRSKYLHDNLDERRLLLFWLYLLVGAAGLKLLFDSVLEARGLTAVNHGGAMLNRERPHAA